MSAEAGTGAASGAMQGAMAGAVAGPVGMIVGGVVGAVGGFLSGSAASDARKYMSRANKIDYNIRVKQAAVQRRDMLRDFRAQRAMQMAAAFSETGGTMSSTTASAMGSFQSQFNTNVGVFDWSAGQQKQMGKMLNKAGQAQSQSAIIATATKALLSVGSAYAGYSQAKSISDGAAIAHYGSQANSNMPQYGGGAGGSGFKG